MGMNRCTLGMSIPTLVIFARFLFDTLPELTARP